MDEGGVWTEMESQLDLEELAPWLEAPLSSKVEPPVETRQQELPLDRLRWEDFERLCVRLVRHEADIEHCQLYGERGQAQDGIDIFARHRGAGSYSVYQCKREEKFGPADIRAAVDKFLHGKWFARASEFVLCLTESGVRTQYAEVIEEQARLLSQHNVLFSPWDRNRISELLKAHPELVHDFFGKEWTRVFCGEEAANALVGRLDASAVQTFRRELGQFYRHVFDRADPGIPVPRKVGSQAIPLEERYVLPDVYAHDAADPSKQPVEGSVAETQSQQRDDRDLAASEALPGSEPRSARSSKELSTSLQSFTAREAVEIWLSRAKRSIVVGVPGSGKSSLLRYIVTDLLSESPKMTKLAAKFWGLLPVWVPFAFWTKLITSDDRESSLNECLKRWLEECDQHRLWPLVRAAIEDKRLLLLVDGLDEWTDETAGRIACDRLHVFIELRDLSAIVVTRPYGFTRLPLFGGGWQAGDLASLSDRQRSELCQKWFRLKYLARGGDHDSDNLPELVKHDVDQFLVELSRSSDLSDLSRVPFLLLLLLYLHLEQSVLPTRRFKAFELMIDRLLTEHPASRRIAASVASAPRGLEDNELKRALARVAFDVQDTRADGLISDDDLQEVVRQFLVDDELGLGMDSSQARALPSQFTHMAEGTLGLLVRQATKQLSFFHRSFQEYLAAFHLARLTLADQKSFVEKHFASPRWKDVLLSLFSMTRRPDELRLLVETMKASTPPESFAVAELRAEAAFGDFDCPADLAKSIAEECFLGIEREPWLPHRERLLDIALQGLHSGKTAELVRQRVRRWVYARNGWQPGWFRAMRRWPADAETQRVLVAGLHDEDPGTQRAAAQTLAEVFRSDQPVGNLLAQFSLKSPRPKLRAAAMEALALGWPEHPYIDSILDHSQRSLSPEVRLANIGIRISRRIQNDSDFDYLLELARRRNDLRVHHSWSGEIANALVNGWSGSQTLKAKCLEAARKNFDFRDESISEGIATLVLLRGFPHDPDVVKHCTHVIANDEHPFIGMFERSKAWMLLREHFQDEPAIVEAIDSWLEKNKVDTMEVACAALVGHTPKAKQVLIETLAASFPHWSAWGLLEGWGIQDSEVSKALLDMTNGPAKFASQVAHLIPQIISDVTTARARLLDILNDPQCVRHDFVVEGFGSLSDKGDLGELVAACFKALPRTEGLHRQSMQHYMIAHFRQVREVYDLAAKELSLRDPPIAVCAVAFAGHSQMRTRIAELVQPLPRALRLRILNKVSNLPPEDEFSLSIVKDYDVEENDELKTIASVASHTNLRGTAGAETAVDQLMKGIACYGPDFEERRRAAFAGLLILERLDLMQDLQEQGGKKDPLSIDLGKWNEPNLPLVRLVAEKWSYLKSVFGDSLPNRISRWYHDCWSPLCRVAADFPDLKTEILSILDADPKLAVTPHALDFVARVKPNSQLLMDRCFSALAASNTNFPRASFAAAEILAESFSGDEQVYSKLLQALPVMRNGTSLYARPQLTVALCVGWPQSPLIDELYNQLLRDPESIHDYAAYFELVLSHCPAAELPERLSRHFAASGVVGNPYVSRALVKALSRRLKKDRDATGVLLSTLTESLQSSNKASITRILATANGLSSELADYCASEIRHQMTLDSSELGFDVVSGEIRGVVLSLLRFVIRNNRFRV